MKLPAVSGPLGRLYKWAFLDLIQPEDDFNQVLRKLIVCVLAMCFGPGLAFACFYGYRMAAGTSSGVAPIMLILAGVVVVPVEIGGYLALRWKRHVSDAMLNAIIWGVLVSFIPVVVSHTGYPVVLNGIMFLVLSIIAQSSTQVLYSAASLCFVFLGIWNDTVRLLPEHHPIPRLMVPDPLIPSPIEFAIAQVGGAMMGVIGCFFVYLQTAEHNRHSAVQAATLEMVSKVAEFIETYDTDSIDVVLDEFVSVSGSNEKLIPIFRRIKDNLALYRPHLPNYLFMVDEKEADEPSEGDVKSQAADSGVEVPSPALSNPLILGTQHPHRSQRGSDVQASTSRRGSRSRQSNCTPEVESALSSIHSSSSQATSLLHTRNNSVGAPHIKTAVRATIVLLKIPTFDNAVMSHHFVSSIFTIAAATLGSVHSFLGNTVQLSWNINTKVTQPEVKATRFMMLLKKDAEIEGYDITAAAWTGIVHSEPCIARKQRATLVTAAWMSSLQAAYALAVRHSAILVDAATYGTTQYVYDCRAVDAVCIPNDEDSHDTQCSLLLSEAKPHNVAERSLLDNDVDFMILYEVAGEAQTHDEWMYNVQATEGSANGAITSEFLLFLKGEASKTVNLTTLIASLPGGQKALQSPLVVRLLRRLATHTECRPEDL